MDPLRLIAQRRMHERQVKVLPAEPKLITAQDLADIKLFATENKITNGNADVVEAELVEIDVGTKLNSLKPKLETVLKKIGTNSNTLNTIEEHVRYLVEKEESSAVNVREKYKPYKTTIHNAHDPEKERSRKQGKHWENTAATPPQIHHKPTQMLSLIDSVEIQKEYIERLKLLHEKQAAERLAARTARLADRRNIQVPSAEDVKTKTAFSVYRNTPNIEGDLDLKEDDEVHDPLDAEKAGGVNFSYSE